MMRSRFLSLLVLLTVAVLFHSCSGLSERAEYILGSNSDRKLIRGVDFGMTRAQVKNIETANLDKEIDDYLDYSLPANELPQDESMQMEYFFNRTGKLDMVMVHYSLQDEARVKLLVEEIHNYFKKKYGEGKKDEYGWYAWEIDDYGPEPGLIEILLSGEINEEGYKGVSLELVKYYEAQD